MEARDHVGIESGGLNRESEVVLHIRIAGCATNRSAEARRLPLHKILGALCLALLTALGSGVPAVSASVAPRSNAKVVIIVGPVGSATSSYEADADYAAATARLYSSNVVTIYTPHATWAAVSAALQGASIVVDMGHGTGYPAPYFKTYDLSHIPAGVDGLGLNPRVTTTDNTTTKYYGEDLLARDIHLAPNAVVILAHLCYSAGNSEPQNKAPSFTVATERADNFTAGWLRTGARAVIAEVYAGHMAGWYIAQLFTTQQTIDDLWRSAPTFNSNVRAFPSVRNSWASIQVDYNPKIPATSNEHFGRSIGGDMSLLSGAVVGIPVQSPYDRVSLGQAALGARGIMSSIQVGGMRAR